MSFAFVLAPSSSGLQTLALQWCPLESNTKIIILLKHSDARQPVLNTFLLFLLFIFRLYCSFVETIIILVSRLLKLSLDSSSSNFGRRKTALRSKINKVCPNIRHIFSSIDMDIKKTCQLLGFGKNSCIHAHNISQEWTSHSTVCPPAFAYSWVM